MSSSSTYFSPSESATSAARSSGGSSGTILVHWDSIEYGYVKSKVARPVPAAIPLG
jgi:hypothetical protein